MRLVTRGDVDGIMCAVLLKAAGIVDSVQQAHPKDMQDGTVSVGPGDIICNLPYVEGCGLSFDHHISEDSEERKPASFKGAYGLAPSAARLVYDFYVSEHPELRKFDSLLETVDRFDSATLTLEDVKSPAPPMLLAFIADPRTGLGLHHHFRISNKQMTDMLPDLMLKQTPEEILALPDFQERVEKYQQANVAAAKIYKERSRVEGNVLITDFRDADPESTPPANRFLVYTLEGHEKTNISIRISKAKGGDRFSLQLGHNIFNRTSKTNVGALMAEFGGGGHKGAGTCQVAAADFDRVFGEILARVRE